MYEALNEHHKDDKLLQHHDICELIRGPSKQDLKEMKYKAMGWINLSRDIAASIYKHKLFYGSQTAGIFAWLSDPQHPKNQCAV